MKDGGAAFPGKMWGQSLEGGPFCEGMSLRDWFAGMALIGIIQHNGQAFPTGSAEIAYEHADAMLKAR